VRTTTSEKGSIRGNDNAGATAGEGLSREIVVLGAVFVLGAIMTVLDLTIVNVAVPSTEPSRNSSSETSQTRLAPKRSLAQPVSGITLANASMYPVITHWIAGIDVPSSRPIVVTILTRRRGRSGWDGL
jgi:hypothetical protein